MQIPASLQSEINYSRKLIEAGLGAVSAAGAGRSSKVLGQEFARSARNAWLPAVVGSAVGLLTMHFARKSKSAGNAVVGALLGGAIGFGGALAWSSRDVTSKVLRSAGKNLNAVRDEHWLEKNPITYG